jgi:hypothetical protein
MWNSTVSTISVTQNQGVIEKQMMEIAKGIQAKYLN